MRGLGSRTHDGRCCALGRELPTIHVPVGDDCDFLPQSADVQEAGYFQPSTRRGGEHARAESHAARSTCTPPDSQAAAPHKVRGPNWTEAEMFVFIIQNCIEWDGMHNCNQPSLAKFVYGSTAWKLVLAGCMSVVGFRARDTNQITNK